MKALRQFFIEKFCMKLQLVILLLIKVKILIINILELIIQGLKINTKEVINTLFSRILNLIFCICSHK